MTDGPPLISIVTPVFNGAEYLAELIESVRTQDYPRIEHIVIDDGSTDGGATAAVLKRFPHVRWWSRENRGQYATMNEGLSAASGEWICFVSADDLVAPGACRGAADHLRRHTDLDGVAGLVQYIDEEGEDYANPPFQSAPIRYYAYLSHISHCSLYISRRKLVNNDLFFDSALHYVGDYEWILRVSERLRIGRMNCCLSKVRIHHAQTSVQQRRKMIKEQWSIVAARKINPVAFELGRGMYIFIHDSRKLLCVVGKKGLKGGGKLVINRLKKIRTKKP
jgi:glycosyltransferase involved in cell wall biosynthesis